MIDRLFFAAFGAITAIAFAFGVFSLGAAMLEPAAPAPRIVELERVVIVGKRLAASAPIAHAEAVAPATRAVQ